MTDQPKYPPENITYLSYTKEEFKRTLERIIDSMQKDKSLYNYVHRTKSRDKDKFTVLGLCDLACNHLFDDYPQLFSITEHEGHVVREYFHFCHAPKEYYINELYNMFPNTFEGESERYVEKNLLDISIPTFK